MIVWSGRGIFSVLVLVVSLLLFMQFLPTESADYGFIGAFFIAGIFSWFLGKKWKASPGRVVIDKATGQEVTMRSRHSLFWIDMQYWGIIFSIIGLIILLQNL
jgi:hypothetical protein